MILDGEVVFYSLPYRRLDSDRDHFWSSQSKWCL